MTKLFQISSNEKNIRRALTSSSKSTFIELSWLVIVLNSFKWLTRNPPYVIFILNNRFIRNNLLDAEGFWYSLANASIKSFLVFSFEI
jgi:hypothetical protein